MTAGLPVRTLTHSGAHGHAHPRLRFATDSILARTVPTPCFAVTLRASPKGRLDHTPLHSLIPRAATYRARDAVGSPPQRTAGTVHIREVPHVQFNFALIYSVPESNTGRSISGV